MTVTTVELQRLARKVWPKLRVCVVNTARYAAIEVDYPSSHGRLLAIEGVEFATEALYVALLVLAGEFDVAALSTQRDQLRAWTPEIASDVTVLYEHLLDQGPNVDKRQAMYEAGRNVLSKKDT